MAQEAEDHGGDALDATLDAQTTGNEGQESGSADPDSSRTSSDIDDLASEMGWVPKEKYRGDPEKWKDARSFVRSTVDVNKHLSKDVRELRDTTERLLKTQSKLVDREVEKKVREAAERFNQAVADGDSRGAFEASEEIRQARQQDEPENNPAEAWRRDNAWYGTHTEASDLAYGVCERLKHRPQAEQLAEAEKVVRKAFPDLFGEKKPEPKAPPMQGGQRSTQGAPRKKGVNDLPPAVRAVAEKEFVRKGKCTLAQYAEMYFEENA